MSELDRDISHASLEEETEQLGWYADLMSDGKTESYADAVALKPESDSPAEERVLTELGHQALGPSPDDTQAGIR